MSRENTHPRSNCSRRSRKNDLARNDWYRFVSSLRAKSSIKDAATRTALPRWKETEITAWFASGNQRGTHNAGILESSGVVEGSKSNNPDAGILASSAEGNRPAVAAWVLKELDPGKLHSLSGVGEGFKGGRHPESKSMEDIVRAKFSKTHLKF